ncbi:UBX domain-containing protein 4-like [Pocillopora verrucosa]|uniref:UBX domain-containing protein 4-like n=1 Tax=Pocillopora verrucosa TaxID=203993 RepID=UPI003341BD38
MAEKNADREDFRCVNHLRVDDGRNRSVQPLKIAEIAGNYNGHTGCTGSNFLTPSGTSSFPELLLWILSPLFTLINFLKAFLFGGADQSRGTQNPPSQRTNSSTQSQPSNSVVRHRVPGGVSSVKKEGGIHQLHNRDDEDDENNTWNGNSTHQM